MQRTLHRQTASAKHVQFAAELQVKIVDDRHICKKPSAKSIIVPIINVLDKQVPPTKNHLPLENLASNANPKAKQKKIKSDKRAPKRFKTNSKYAVVLLEATNIEIKPTATNIHILTSSEDPSESKVVQANNNLPIVPKSSLKFFSAFGLKHLAEPFARWLCQRQVANAMEFLTQQWSKDQERRLRRPGSSRLELPRSPRRTPSEPVRTSVRSRLFKRSDGRLVYPCFGCICWCSVFVHRFVQLTFVK